MFQSFISAFLHRKMQNPDIHSSDYWLRWQVFLCGFIIVAPSSFFIFVLFKVQAEPLYFHQLWKSQWRKLNPRWLLCYRALAFVIMALILADVTVSGGAESFYFYTQWTFTLVTVYFGLGTVISAYGCWGYSNKTSTESVVIASDVEEGGIRASLCQGENADLQSQKNAEEDTSKRAGFWGYLMQIIYQTCGGAAVLTDIVEWCILVPSSTNKVDTMDVLTHSLNVVLLLLDASLNSMPFPWFRFAYFVMWSCSYIVFQWALHACCVSWWPYDFLDLNSSWAPLWYLGVAVAHIPCYGIYALIVKAKNSILSKMFPNAFVNFH